MSLTINCIANIFEIKNNNFNISPISNISQLEKLEIEENIYNILEFSIDSFDCQIQFFEINNDNSFSLIINSNNVFFQREIIDIIEFIGTSNQEEIYINSKYFQWNYTINSIILNSNEIEETDSGYTSEN